jgi:diguanylate cyclase (GGDEF)-like protein
MCYDLSTSSFGQNDMNSWWGWRKALFGKVDQDYRQAFLREDKAQVRILIAIVAIWALGYSYVEYLDLNLTHLYYLLGILRISFFIASIALFLKLPKMNNIETVDFAILVWSIACVLLVFISNLSRNNIYVKNIGANLAWALGFYLVLPNRQLFKSIPALLMSIFIVYILSISENTSFLDIIRSTLLSNIAAIIAFNALGFLVSLRLDAQRYQQYLIQRTLVNGRAQLKQLATTDSLTGILNRRSFFESAEVQFDRFKRYKERFSFVIIDIDNLKKINDTYGHPAGDHSILLMTDTINAEKRSSDVIGRLAGDEFGIILPNTSAGKTLDVLLRIQEVLGDTIVESPNKRQFQVNFSAGVTQARKADETFDELYRRADKALLAAKQSGRKRIEIG